MNALRHGWKRSINGWTVSILCIATLILIPLITVLGGMWESGPEWEHITSTVLPKYINNTLILVCCVGALSLLLAIPAAWFVSVFEFPGRKIFEWALVLPLAIPTYVAAFTYIDGLEAVIPLLIYIRKTWGVDAYLWAEQFIRYGLLCLLMSSVLFPYLYISVRTSFRQQQSAFVEAARTLGRSNLLIFFEIALPLARPAIIAGVSLIIMEVVNDYGAVHFFGVPTLTEGIFRTWFGLGDQASGVRLAGVVMLIIFLLLSFEYWQRGRARFTTGETRSQPYTRAQLKPLAACAVFAFCAIPLALGFLFPVIRLIHWATITFESVEDLAFLQEVGRSLYSALFTSALLCSSALLFAYCWKLHPNKWFRRFTSWATIGYAIPGAVIAIGVMQVFGWLDQHWLSQSTSLISGTIFAIGFAYMIRFFAVAFQPINAGMTQVCGSMDDASRMLGRSPASTLCRINIPLLKGTLIGATMLVFIDIIKELPLTLILRPAEFETLATVSFGYAKEGKIYDCALPSLMIISLGAAGLLVLNRWMHRST